MAQWERSGDKWNDASITREAAKEGKNTSRWIRMNEKQSQIVLLRTSMAFRAFNSVSEPCRRCNLVVGRWSSAHGAYSNGFQSGRGVSVR